MHLFVEVVRAGSFAEAARRLGVPANSVSRHIQRLESDLGSRLIHRSTRKLALTNAGRTFFERCAPAIAELAQAGEQLAAENPLPGGLLRVAAPADFFDLFPLEWVASFLDSYPQIRLEFALDDAKTDLITESIDVAIRSGNLVDDHHVGHKLVHTRFWLVASPGYLAARGLPTSLESLRAHDCLTQSHRSGPVVWHLQGPEGQREAPVSGRLRANTARALLRAAVAGLGIALLPEPIVTPQIRAGNLVQILPDYQRAGADLYAVYVSRRQVPRAVGVFIEFVAERLRRGSPESVAAIDLT